MNGTFLRHFRKQTGSWLKSTMALQDNDVFVREVISSYCNETIKRFKLKQSFSSAALQYHFVCGC